MFNNLFFENRAVYEIMWKNVVEPELECVLHGGKATRAHTHKYVLLFAFSRQERFREHACMLRHTYIACPVF